MNLDHSVEQIVRQLLIDKGLGVAASYDDESGLYDGGAWPVFYSVEPDAPDNVITVYDTEPKVDARIQYSGQYAERPGIQIRIRGQTRIVARAKADAITQILEDYDSVYDEYVSLEDEAYLVHCFNRASGPFAIGQAAPQSKLQLVTINYTVVLGATTYTGT